MSLGKASAHIIYAALQVPFRTQPPVAQCSYLSSPPVWIHKRPFIKMVRNMDQGVLLIKFTPFKKGAGASKSGAHQG